MKQGALVAVAAVAVGIAAGGGYWLGRQGPADAAPSAAPAERKPLYYRNPMGLPDTSPVPKKDPMGMDYIPVYAGEEAAGDGSHLSFSNEKIQKLGVRAAPVEMKALGRLLRASGRVEPDERRTYAVAPKFEGYVERLLVNASGQAVAKGQPLFEVYSPELVSAQREYAIARESAEALAGGGAEAQAGMRQLAEASLARLRNWDIPESQLKSLAQSGEGRRTLTLRSPVAGIVTEKKAVQGMRFMPGETLYQVTDLSAVWVLADVPEREIGQIRVGAPAKVQVDAYPGQAFAGKVAYVYPTLNAETRTVPVRIELANPGLRLKPAMFAAVELAVGGEQPVLAVPASAVLDSGTRRLVFVQVGEGRFEPREVKLGARGDEQVEVLDGVRAGEAVVVAANFLIDAESNLKAAGNAMQPAASAGHRAEGKIESIDVGEDSASISHGPVASLKWPAMTMEFKFANAALLQGLKPGAAIAFEFVERGQGEWVITSVKPAEPAHRH